MQKITIILEDDILQFIEFIVFLVIKEIVLISLIMDIIIKIWEK